MSEDYQIYFNPQCSKCRSALDVLSTENVEVEVIHYLDQPIKQDQLNDILDGLTDPIPDLVRKDRRFSELGLIAEDYVTRDTVINLILQHPELMQRPLIHKDGKWSIARSPERVRQIVNDNT